MEGRRLGGGRVVDDVVPSRLERFRAVREEGVVRCHLQGAFRPGRRLVAADCGDGEEAGAAGSGEDLGGWPGQRAHVHFFFSFFLACP